jgi:hypothetical protein
MSNLLEKLTKTYIDKNSKPMIFKDIQAVYKNQTDTVSSHKAPNDEVCLGQCLKFIKHHQPGHIYMHMYEPNIITDMFYIEEYNIMVGERYINREVHQIIFKEITIGEHKLYEITYHNLESFPLHNGTIHPIP